MIYRAVQISFVLLFCISVSYGQINSEKDVLNEEASTYDPTSNGFHIGVTPSALLNIWMGYQFKAGYTFKDNYNYDLEVAYITLNANKPYNGYRIKNTFKYFITDTYSNTRTSIGIGYLYRSITETDYNASYAVFGGQYFQSGKSVLNSRLHGIFANIESMTNLDDHFFITGGAGLGVGTLNLSYDGGVPNGQLDRGFEILPILRDPGQRLLPVLLVHVSFGYKF